MYDLRTMLQTADSGVMYLLPKIWGVETGHLSKEDTLEAMVSAMQDEQRIEALWDKLSDEQRQALQNLYASKRVMPVSQFNLLYGSHRRMGRSQIERDQPHLKPQSIAEAL